MYVCMYVLYICALFTHQPKNWVSVVTGNQKLCIIYCLIISWVLWSAIKTFFDSIDKYIYIYIIIFLM